VARYLYQVSFRSNVLNVIKPTSFLKTEKKKREGKVGEAVRDTTFRGGGAFFLSPVLKVPRQCPLVFPVQVYLSEASGSEKI
jgi:hypothetical protein